MSHIEQRLVEMEILALELLSACEGASISTEAYRLTTDQRQVFVDHAQKQSKSDKIEEWKGLPISDPQQRQAWWSVKQGYPFMPDASRLQQRLDNVASVGMTPTPGHAGNLRPMDSVSSLAQAFPRPPLFAASPSISVQEGPTINSPVSISHDASTEAGDGKQGQGTPAVAMATAEMSPPASRNVAPDKWRKYF